MSMKDSVIPNNLELCFFKSLMVFSDLAATTQVVTEIPVSTFKITPLIIQKRGERKERKK